MSFYLAEPPDFARHNDEVKKVWDAYRARKPYRVPVTVGGSITNLFCNPALNPGWSFERFFSDPQVQIDAQLAYRKWCRYNLLCDYEMGPPKDGWQIGVDFQNSYEAGWFGCPLRFWAGQVPDTVEMLKEKKERLYDLDPPAPLGNLLARAVEFFDYMQERCPRMEFEGRPVVPPTTIPGEGTDGLFTLACKVRGLTECCIDMLADPDYYHDLMAFITDNVIRRIKAIKEWRWARKSDSPDKGQYKMPYWFADDSIAMLSVTQYEEFVYPYHRRLVDEFSDGSPIGIHLCGDATRHFRMLRERLNITSFDTGFPVDFGRLRSELGPEVQIQGGPTIMLLKSGPAEAVRAEVERICRSGVMEGGRFILREGNNMAPCTPVEHVAAMYEAGKEFGRFH